MCRLPNARWRQMCDSDKIMAEVRVLSYPGRALPSNQRSLYAFVVRQLTSLRNERPNERGEGW